MSPMTSAEIEQTLDQQRVGRLAMADASGRPYVIPLPFCWLNDALYLRVPLTGRKGQVLRENDQVCFEVDYYSQNMDDYASVLIEGRLVEVEDVEEKSRVKEANSRKYMRLRSGYRPGHGRTTPIQAMALRKIVVQAISGRKKDAEIAQTA